MPRKYTRIDHAAAFWSKVDQSGDCWLWLGRRDSDGYGRFGIWGRGDLRTNRYAWELAYGPIPDGLWVLHHCDNPACVRPDHLFLGDCFDNVADMVAKGRQNGERAVVPPDPLYQQRTRDNHTRGEGHHAAKLDESKVRAIRERRANGETITALASEFGVTPALISGIAKRRAWKHVT